MAEALTDLTEAAVGAACLLGAWLAWTRIGRRGVAVAIGAFGVAAIGHAVWSAATG